jgi:hypothetical protein
VECLIFSRLPRDDPCVLSADTFSSSFSPSAAATNSPAFAAILPLRLLELRKKDPDTWDRVQLLMDHNHEMTEEEKIMWNVSND